MKIKTTISTILLGLSLLAADAQNSVYDVNLNEVEVSADRTKMYSDLGRILTVVEKVEIEQAAVRSIDELLDFVAGVDVRQRGVNGVQADISIRGGSFDQLLVLLNGVNITDPQTGHYNLDIPIDIADINRVEILQGSVARLLGPNAFSGAVNIITGEHAESYLANQTTAGSDGYLSQNVSANYISDQFRIFGTTAYKRSDGYIENTDFSNFDFYIQSQFNPSKVSNFTLQLGYQQKSFGANSFYSTTYPNQYEHTKTLFSALNWNQKLGSLFFNTQVYWRQHHDRFELFRNFEGASPTYKGHNYHLTDVMGGKLVASKLWIGGKSSLGADIRNEHIFSNVLGTPMNSTKPVPFEKGKEFTYEANRLLTTFYLDHSLNIDRWFASLGASFTHSDKFGSHLNGGADLAFKPSAYSRVYIAANSAVRLPTFTDLYYKSPIQISNPNLKPEKSITFELGTKINPLSQTFSAVSYYRLGSNIIDWVKTSDAEMWESRNLTNVNAFGFDLNYEYRFSNIFIHSVGAGYSFLHLDKKAEGYDSKYALDYLKHKAVIKLNHAIWSKLSGHWNLGMYDRSGDYTDARTNSQVNYTPYWMLNFKLLWKNKQVSLFTEVNNVLNQKYVDFGGILLPGINFNTGIRLTLL